MMLAALGWAWGGTLQLRLSSEALGTLEGRAWSSVAPNVFVGGGLDLPLTLWAVTGVPDTGRIEGGIATALLTKGGFFLGADASLAMGVQVPLLGPQVSLGSEWRLEPSWQLGAVVLGPCLGWEQPLATLITFSDYTRAAFVDSGTAPPTAGVVPFGTGRGALGARIVVALRGGWSTSLTAERLLTPDHFDLAWTQELVSGVWPARAVVGISRSR